MPSPILILPPSPSIPSSFLFPPQVLPDQAPIPATFLSTTPFTSYPLHANSQKALKDGFKYAFPSAPQALYLDKALQGMDVFVKVRSYEAFSSVVHHLSTGNRTYY